MSHGLRFKKAQDNECKTCIAFLGSDQGSSVGVCLSIGEDYDQRGLISHLRPLNTLLTNWQSTAVGSLLVMKAEHIVNCMYIIDHSWISWLEVFFFFIQVLFSALKG